MARKTKSADCSSRVTEQEVVQGSNLPKEKQKQKKIYLLHRIKSVSKDAAAALYDAGYDAEILDPKSGIDRNRLTNEPPDAVVSHKKFLSQTEYYKWSKSSKNKDGKIPSIVVLDRDALDEVQPDKLERIKGRLSIGGSEIVRECHELGVLGFVAAENIEADIVRAVENVLRWEPYYASSVYEDISKMVADLSALKEQASELDIVDTPLTPRELQVLTLVLYAIQIDKMEDMTNAKIAEVLGMRLYTAKNHIHNAFDKLKAFGKKGRRQSALFAEDRDWIPVDVPDNWKSILDSQ